MNPGNKRTLEELKARISAHHAQKKLSRTRLAVIGRHPDGFHTCAYDAEELKKLAGVTVDQLELKDLFDCLLYTSPSPRDATLSRMPSSA